ncbi:MAG TPA: 3-deoxy-D-manno-octulosonic acid kinase [Rhodanobacteraceae bacterium]|nr:3-deoxy-D-manno-octulosonic acid kinase [Rhodanobacteraceae bacterium]
MKERIVTDAAGAWLADAAHPVQAEWLDLDWWREQGRARALAGGRGGVAVVAAPGGDCVLRHYRRGGLLARWLGDRYVWRGPDQTRSFAEFRLLARLDALGLPVPRVVAARYRRLGRHYTADILTRRIAAAQTLADAIAAQRLDVDLACRVGSLVGRFHRAGVFHADLNAHNVLINVEGLHLLDFDRGRLRPPARGWQQANLDRLRRSLLKVGAFGGDASRLDASVWPALLAAWNESVTA